jgi:hypothetical protein
MLIKWTVRTINSLSVIWDSKNKTYKFRRNKDDLDATLKEEYETYEKFGISRGGELLFTRYAKNEDNKDYLDQQTETGKSRARFMEMRRKEITQRNSVLLQTRVEDIFVGEGIVSLISNFTEPLFCSSLIFRAKHYKICLL